MSLTSTTKTKYVSTSIMRSPSSDVDGQDRRGIGVGFSPTSPSTEPRLGSGSAYTHGSTFLTHKPVSKPFGLVERSLPITVRSLQTRSFFQKETGVHLAQSSQNSISEDERYSSLRDDLMRNLRTDLSAALKHDMRARLEICSTQRGICPQEKMIFLCSPARVVNEPAKHEDGFSCENEDGGHDQLDDLLERRCIRERGC